MTTTFGMKKLRIGITIGLHHEAETLQNIGIKQNAVFLAEALKNCPNVQSVVLVNTTRIRITDQLPWDLDRWPTTDDGTATFLCRARFAVDLPASK